MVHFPHEHSNTMQFSSTMRGSSEFIGKFNLMEIYFTGDASTWYGVYDGQFSFIWTML